MVCDKCGGYIPDGKKFCPMCGVKVESEELNEASENMDLKDQQTEAENINESRNENIYEKNNLTCSCCGAPIPEGKKFCPMCGAKVEENSAPEAASEEKKTDSLPPDEPKEKVEKSENVHVETKQKSGSGGINKKKAGIIGGLCAAGAAVGIIVPVAVSNAGKSNVVSDQGIAQTTSAYSIATQDEETTESTNNMVTNQTTGQTTVATTQNTVSADNSITLDDVPVTSNDTYRPTSGETFTAEPATIISREGYIYQLGQVDGYTFTAPRDGRYRVSVYTYSGLDDVNIFFYDSNGELIDSAEKCTDGDGVTVKNLIGGSNYEIRVSQNDGIGSYYIDVGLQKPTIDISALSQVYDSMEYTDQRNLYSFTVPTDGTYTFSIAGMYSGDSVQMYIFDDPGNKIDSNDNCINGTGLALKNVKAGDVYEIQVRQGSGMGDYILVVQ